MPKLPEERSVVLRSIPAADLLQIGPLMTPLLAAATPWAYGPVFPFFFFLIPLFWITLLVLLAVFLSRGARRRWAAYGPGWSQGRSAESTLAERFANGDIDEIEYRARLEVLRANREQPR
jgi:putative membrane protein